MAKSRHKKSEETRATDGRSNNRRLAPKPITAKDKQQLPAARSTPSKKERLQKKGLKAIKEKFGDEQGFFDFILNEATEEGSFNHLKMFMEYTYGKASDSIDDTAKKQTITAPVINFYGDNAAIKDKIIDITPDEDSTDDD
jgi:hypothetical protein